MLLVESRVLVLGCHVALQAVGRTAGSPGSLVGTAVTGSFQEPQPLDGGSLVAMSAVSPQTPLRSAVECSPPRTCLICLNPSGCTLEKMLHSGWARIWKATAQWWFSRGEMSL